MRPFFMRRSSSLARAGDQVAQDVEQLLVAATRPVAQLVAALVESADPTPVRAGAPHRTEVCFPSTAPGSSGYSSFRTISTMRPRLLSESTDLDVDTADLTTGDASGVCARGPSAN